MICDVLYFYNVLQNILRTQIYCSIYKCERFPSKYSQDNILIGKNSTSHSLILFVKIDPRHMNIH